MFGILHQYIDYPFRRCTQCIVFRYHGNPFPHNSFGKNPISYFFQFNHFSCKKCSKPAFHRLNRICPSIFRFFYYGFLHCGFFFLPGKAFLPYNRCKYQRHRYCNRHANRKAGHGARLYGKNPRQPAHADSVGCCSCSYANHCRTSRTNHTTYKRENIF